MTALTFVSTGRWNRLRATALIGLLLASAPAFAANLLETVSYSVAGAGRVDIRMELADGAVEARDFATESPARIAIDLIDTQNGWRERRLPVGSGAVSAVSAVESGGRTRLVVDLLRPASYALRQEGNALILTVESGVAMGGGSAVLTAETDPTKRGAIASRNELARVDFRRGKDGEGRIQFVFTGEGVGADLRELGNRIQLELANVRVTEANARRLDVTDFATPVQYVDVKAIGDSGARVEIGTSGTVETLAYQTGNEYIVEIKQKREDTAAERRNMPPEYGGQRVTFNFQDIPVRSVLQLIADVSELNVVVADSVQGNITLRLVNVPWDQALDIILQAKGLDKRTQGNVIWIAPQAEIATREQEIEDARIAMEDRAELVTDYIPINFGNAEAIKNLLTTDAEQASGGGGGSTGSQGNTSRGFVSPRGSVSFDERTNTLIVNDIPQKIEEIRELIALLDRPVQQVLIESRIVIANESFARDLGARFGISGAREDGEGNIISTGGSSNALDRMNAEAIRNRYSGRSRGLPVYVEPDTRGDPLVAPPLGERLNFNLPVGTAGAGSFALAILGADYLLDLELSALQAEGRGEVVSNPRVITANNREAVIKQGDEIGYQTTQVSGGVAQTTVNFKEVVLELKVTPTITNDGRVFLALNVKKDEVAELIQTPQGIVPAITKREINTAVLVQNGETVVLGGVYEISSREDLQKVPFLGDVPVLGNLFRNKNKTTSKAELLIFVTPKLLRETLQ
jgi:type IV pilus assembly protein PilQ